MSIPIMAWQEIGLFHQTPCKAICKPICKPTCKTNDPEKPGFAQSLAKL